MVAGAHMAEEKHIKHSFMSNTNSTVCSERKTGLRNNPHSYPLMQEERKHLFTNGFVRRVGAEQKLRSIHSDIVDILVFLGTDGLLHSRVRAVYFGTAVASLAPMRGRLPCS